MSTDTERDLKKLYHGFVAFSITVDASDDITDNLQRAIFTRGIDRCLTVTEKSLGLMTTKETTTGANIFSVLEKLVELVQKYGFRATDSTLIVVETKNGLVGHMQAHNLYFTVQSIAFCTKSHDASRCK